MKAKKPSHFDPERRALQHYRPRVQPGRPRYDMLDWGSRKAQMVRFQVLTRILRGILPGLAGEGRPRPRLLDVGCGFAELADHLEQVGLKIDYVGLDLCPEFVAAARQRHPGLDLLIGDAFGHPPFPDAVFDFVFCSGTLNLRMENHDRFVRRALAAMLRVCRHSLIVNFLHQRVVEQYEHCRYYLPETAAALLPAQTGPVEIIDDYLENDFTMTVRKPQAGLWYQGAFA